MADMQDEKTTRATFSELGLNEWLATQCEAVGMLRPSPIQYYCVPEILKGRDCIGCAKTGSGKTAAFALPVLQKLCEDPYGIFALVLTPTRELAYQISEQFQVLGKPIGIRVSTVIGGRDMVLQGKDLNELPHILIATPGRLADHLEKGATTINLKKIRFLILDEADRLLEDNFGAQLRTIFWNIPKKRQTLLFSATVTDTLKELQEVAMNKPFVWQAENKQATVEQLDQRYVLMPADVKDAYMVHILDQFIEKNPNSSMMIFTNTCKYCQLLGMVLREVGIPCQTLHSMIPQRQRISALAKFKSHQVKVLIATDVASRGLDIPSVDLIINHNIPNRPKDYIHRVGRTARAGRGGKAISLVTQFDIKLVHAIESHIKTKLSEEPTDESEVTKIVTEVAVARREAEIKLDEADFGEKKEVYKMIKLMEEGKNPEEEAKNEKKRLKQTLRKRRKEREARESKKKQKTGSTSKDS